MQEKHLVEKISFPELKQLVFHIYYMVTMQVLLEIIKFASNMETKAKFSIT